MYDIITIGTVSVDTFIKENFLKTVSDKKHLAKIGFKTGKAQCLSFGSKIEIEAPQIHVGGGAYNAAVTFSRTGFKTASFFNVGDDNDGKIIVEAMEKEKATPLTVVDKNKPTAHSFILLSKNGERTILVSRGCSGAIEKREIPFNELLRLRSGQVRTGWAYVVSGNIPFFTLKSLFDFFKRNKISVALAPSKDLIQLGLKKISPLLNYSKVVTLNREEASYLTGVSFFKKEKIFKVLDKHIDGLVVMTDGSKGAYVSDGRTLFECGIFKEKKVVDRTGAGDAFGSGFVAGLIETTNNKQPTTYNKKQVEYALRRAEANATAVIEKVGAAEGVLTKNNFLSDKRWKHFPLKTAKL